MRITATLIALLAMISVSSAQNNDPGHENHFKQLPPWETNELKVEFSDAHAQMGFALIKLNITNKTRDFILFTPESMKFQFADGTVSPDGKAILVKPNSSKKYTAKVTGSINFHVETYTLLIDGFYKVSSTGVVVTGDKYQLPVNKNNFSVGAFSCNMLDIVQETQETVVKFKCTYEGNKIGLLDPSNLIVITEKGEWANDYSKSELALMNAGDTEKFVASFHVPGKIVDMQFAVMHIDWKNTFRESSKQPLPATTLNLVLDVGLTSGKN